MLGDDPRDLLEGEQSFGFEGSLLNRRKDRAHLLALCFEA
jgi:hypothetical protein